MRAALLAVMVLMLAGCIAPAGDGRTPHPPPLLDVDPRDCPEAAEAPLRLARHTDHSGGTSEYWTLWPNGTLLRVWGNPTSPWDRTQVTFGGSWGEPATRSVCAAIAGFVRDGPGGPPGHTSLVVETADVGWLAVEADAVSPLLHDAMDLPADSSYPCLSGGDTWLAVHVEGARHTVEARCAPDAGLAAWLARLYEAVGARPFEW